MIERFKGMVRYTPLTHPTLLLIRGIFMSIITPNMGEIIADMRIIAKSTIKKFWEQPAYRDARGPLESWYEETLKASWPSPQAVKDQ